MKIPPRTPFLPQRPRDLDRGRRLARRGAPITVVALAVATTLGACAANPAGETAPAPSASVAGDLSANDALSDTPPRADSDAGSAPRLAAPDDRAAAEDAAPIASAPPAATATPAASPTPGPGRLVRLTSGGCCTRPSFSADGGAIRYIDRPAPEGPTGIYQIAIDAPGSTPTLRSETVAYYLGDLEYRLELGGGSTTVERLADGERWNLPSGGRPVWESPDLSQVAWTSAPDVNYERRVTTVWVAPFAGGDPREVARLPRGSLQGWLDEGHLLISGREQLNDDEDVMWVLDVATGERSEITRGARLRETRLSPDGRRMAWLVTQREEASENGLFVVDLGPVLDAAPGVAATAPPPTRLDLPFGAYAWRDADRLLLIPLEPGSTGMRLLEHDLLDGQTRDRTPGSEPFVIDSGDWTIAPDGRHVAFVSAGDRNIWLIALD